MYHCRLNEAARFSNHLIGLRNGRRNIRDRVGRIGRHHSHSFKISECLRKHRPACSSVQYSERKWQSDWHWMTKRAIGFSRARACCSGRHSDDIHKFRFRTQNWRPAPWLRPASPAYSRSQRAIFSGIAVRAGISMSARQNGSEVFPIYSRRDLAAFGFDNSQTNRLRVIEIFCWT